MEQNKPVKLWAAPDGNDGYDVGSGDYCFATVRDIKIAEGYRVAKGFEKQHGYTFAARKFAMLFRAAPDMLAVLEFGLNCSTAAGGVDIERFERFKTLARAAIARAKGE